MRVYELETMKKLFYLIAFAIIFSAVALGLYDLLRSKSNPNELVLYGNVDVRQVNIGFRVPGRVVDLLFEEGDFVPKGSLMAVLEKTPYDNQISQQEEMVESARTNYENAELMLERRLKGIDVGGVTEEDLDTAQATRDELFATLNAAIAALNVARDNMSYTEVFAPTDGIILTRIREPGTAVNAVDPVYTLSVISPVWIRAFVNEPNLGKIYYGMKAQISTDSGLNYDGQIGFISPVAEFTPKTVETTQLRTDLVYRLRVYAENPDRFLKQGMPVTVTLRLDNKEAK